MCCSIQHTRLRYWLDQISIPLGQSFHLPFHHSEARPTLEVLEKAIPRDELASSFPTSPRPFHRRLVDLEDFTLPHIFQVDSAGVQVVFQSPPGVQVHFFGWEHSQIGTWTPPGVQMESRWTRWSQWGPHARWQCGFHLNPTGVQEESV